MLFTPANGMRLMGEAYSLFLLSLVPLIGAALAAFVLRKRSAGERVLIWRATVIVLLMVFAGQFLPFQWKAWIVPQELASPFIAMGRAQLAVLEQVAPLAGDGTLLKWLLGVYAVGVLGVTIPMLVAFVKLRRATRSAARLDCDEWKLLLAEARMVSGVSRKVRLIVSAESVVPLTWGVLRPVVLVPFEALHWPREHQRAALLHELNHVRNADALFALAARLMCALHWFNPAAWWVAARLRAESELACDDRVLAGGVRRSDYAELLGSAGAGRGAWLGGAGALALGRRTGVRARIEAIVDTGRVVRLPARAATAAAAGITLFVSASVSLVQIVPTRDVLTTLLQDERWESRAYAVVRLAERADSVEVARAAAHADPSPRVRAWAQYALAQLPPPTGLFLPSLRP